MKNQKLFSWSHGHHGNHKCPQKFAKKIIIIAIYVTIGATNLTIIFFFMLHVGYDMYASEMKTKSENIL